MDLDYICTVIGNLSGIPVRIYENGEQTFFYSVVELPKDPICIYLDKILSLSGHVSYFITPTFSYYGVVKAGDITVVLGPTRQTAAEESDLRKIAFNADVPSVDIDDFIIAMQNVVRLPLDSVLQILFTLNHILSGEKLTLKDLKIYDSEQENLRALLGSVTNADTQEDFPDDYDNNTFALEQTLMNFVRHGDLASLKQWIASAPAVKPGILAVDYLRQYKNTFIVTVTIVCRNAIRGGVDVHESLARSDMYIQKCELMNSVEDITNLQYCMILDFTERVERIRHGKNPTQLTRDVTNYILHHISEPIKTEDIASAVYLSRSRLSVRFKEEAGITLTDFILKEKIAESKRLLRYTDKTIISISDYLGFSSHAHFSRVFKKYTGLTPNEYRERKQ